MSCSYFVLVTIHPRIFVFCFLGGDDTGEEASPTEGEGANEGASPRECGGSDCVRSEDEVKGKTVSISYKHPSNFSVFLVWVLTPTVNFNFNQNSNLRK